jgi:hypothetical protein
LKSKLSSCLVSVALALFASVALSVACCFTCSSDEMGGAFLFRQ